MSVNTLPSPALTPEEERLLLMVQLQQFIPRRMTDAEGPDGATKEVDTAEPLRGRLADFIIADRRRFLKAVRFPLLLGMIEENYETERVAAVGIGGVRLLQPQYLSQRRDTLSKQLRDMCNGEST